MRSARIAVPLCSALLATLAGGVPPACAADPTDDATGIALFNEAKHLVGLNDYEHACPKYAEAQRLHPAAAILLNLADCLEHVNKVASAWGAWKEAEIMARNAGDTEREQVAARRGEALGPQLAKLAIVVPPTTRVPGLEVRKDGALVGEAQYGSSLPADVGAHTIEASAPGHKEWSTVVRVDTNGSSASVEIPALEALVGPSAAGEKPAPFWSTLRIAGAAVGGAGIAGLVVGSAFGVIAISKKNQSNAGSCNTADVCDPTGMSLRADGIRAGNISTGAFIGGAVALAGGLTLFLVAPSGAPKSGGKDGGVALSFGVGDVRLIGRW